MSNVHNRTAAKITRENKLNKNKNLKYHLV